MADFSQYTGPSDEWVAVERSLPAPPQLTPEQLKAVTNQGREETAAREMDEQGLRSKVIIHDYTIPTRDGASIEARSYRPVDVSPSQRLPVYIHLHGGGFLFGTVATEDSTCARIVTSLSHEGVPIVVLNVNYRHTPEHRYPTAWEDVEDAFVWTHANLTSPFLTGDAENVVMGGISAGAWLTASTTLSQHLGTSDVLSSLPRIKGQVLMIPALVHPDCYAPQLRRLRDPQVSSWVENKNAPLLPLDRVKLFMGLLGLDRLPSAGSREDAERDLRLNPGNATGEQVRGLPPATFGVAGLDPLRDEGLLYAQLLSENGVPTRTNVFRGLPHGFRRYAQLSASKKWDEVMVEGIKWALSEPEGGEFDIRAF